MKKIIFIISLLLFVSCVKREEVEAVIWLNNFNEAITPLCEKYPELIDFGFYRKLNDDKREFISICNPVAKDMLAIHKNDFNRLLDKALPKKKKDYKYND